MNNIKIEIGKEYTCEKCGCTGNCKETCYGLSYTVKRGKVWCLDCEMNSFFAEYVTASE